MDLGSWIGIVRFAAGPAVVLAAGLPITHF